MPTAARKCDWNDVHGTPRLTAGWDPVWTTWNVDWCTSNTASSRAVWYTWSTSSATTGDVWSNNVWEGWVVDGSSYKDERTPEQIEAERKQVEEWRKAEAERAEQRRLQALEAARAKAEAVETAQRLLEENLTEAEREQLKTARYLTVESGASKRRYRIWAGKGCHGNIEEIDEQGNAVARLCCAPRGDIPEGDYLLGQKLHLQYNEDEFRRTANITPLQRTG